jgi:hypothetical protein
MSMHVWVGTSRIVGKGLFGDELSEKAHRLGSTSGKELPRQKPPSASTTASHDDQGGSSRGKPNGHHHSFPVHHTTEQVAYPLQPAIFLPE